MKWSAAPRTITGTVGQQHGGAAGAIGEIQKRRSRTAVFSGVARRAEAVRRAEAARRGRAARRCCVRCRSLTRPTRRRMSLGKTADGLNWYGPRPASLPELNREGEPNTFPCAQCTGRFSRGHLVYSIAAGGFGNSAGWIQVCANGLCFPAREAKVAAQIAATGFTAAVDAAAADDVSPLTAEDAALTEAAEAAEVLVAAAAERTTAAAAPARRRRTAMMEMMGLLRRLRRWGSLHGPFRPTRPRHQQRSGAEQPLPNWHRPKSKVG